MTSASAKNDAGFTLIEVIAVIIIIGVISVFTFLFIVTGVSGYLSTYENTVLAQKAGIAMARISTELLEEMESVDGSTYEPGTSGSNAYLKYGCNTDNCSSGARHLILLGSGTRKDLVLADQSATPDTTNEELLMENVSSFTIELFKDCSNRDDNDSKWASGDAFSDIACIRISMVVFINDMDTDTETFETILRPVISDDVI